MDQVNEMESYVQEMEHSAPSKHVVLKRTAPWDWMTTPLDWHAIIPWDGMIMMNKMVLLGVDGMRRLGIG